MTKGFEAKVKRPCVVLAFKTQLNPLVSTEFPMVSLNNSDVDLDSWLREDRHGTRFDTGCNVIVTKVEDLDQRLERMFKNLLWIVLDRLPKEQEMDVERPVVELYTNIAVAHCPFEKKPKVSFYDE